MQECVCAATLALNKPYRMSHTDCVCTLIHVHIMLTHTQTAIPVIHICT